MEVFRLSRAKYADTLSGIGAALNGARWNGKGTELIYTATNRSLAMAEVAVHLSIATLPSDYLMLTIHIPDDVSLLALPINELPHNWNAFPHPAANQKFGDDFVRGNRACCLRVPSAVTKGDFNLLINPRHADFSRISIVSKEDFGFDNRLFRD